MADSESTDSESTDGWTLGEVFGRPHDARLVCFFLPAAAALAGLGLVPLRSWDYWWHLTMGRLVNYWGAVPDANHYLYTVPEDAPSYLQPWLSDLLLFGFHVNTSLHDALILRNAVAVLAVGWCGYRTMSRARSVAVGSLVALAAVPVVWIATLAGPSIFAWLLFPLLLELCLRVDGGDLGAAWLAGIPAVAALWANLHAGFWIAGLVPAVIGAGAHLRTRRDADAESASPDWYVWCAAAAAALLAAMLNPRGPEIFGFLAAEWLSVFSGPTPGGASVEPLLGFGLLGYWPVLLWCAGAALAALDRNSVDPTDALLVGALGLAALLPSNGLIWLALGLPVAVAPSAGRLAPALDPDDAPGGFAQRLYTAAALLCVVVAVGTQPTWQWRVDWMASSSWSETRQRAPLAGVAPADTPHEAVEFLARRVEPPRLFHDRRYAGYLMYHLTDERPLRKFFVDARDRLPTDPVWDEYRSLGADEPPWSEVFTKYGIEAAVLSAEHSDLVDRLEKSDEWAILMQDDHFTLLLPVGES